MNDWTSGAARILLHTCRSCSSTWYLPHEYCPACRSPGHRTAAAAGTGLCVAVTRVHVTADGGEPIGLALAELDEGVLVMGRTGGPVQPGDRVQVHFDSPPALTPTFRRTA